MKVIKSNQIIVVSIAIMLIIVGYLNYGTDFEGDEEYIQTSTNTVNEIGLGDAKLVNAEVKENYKEGIVENNDDFNSGATIAQQSTTIQTSTETDYKDNDYFVKSRMEREAMYSQMLETYNKILENSAVSNEQKAIATNEITKISDTKNAIMISENLIKTKGFDDVIIFANSDSINVVVKAAKLNTEEISRLQNIISREMNTEIENIHISNK